MGLLTARCPRPTRPPASCAPHYRYPRMHRAIHVCLSAVSQPGLCLVGSNWPPGILADPPTHPPTHPHQKIFPRKKNEIYQRGPNLEVDFRYTNFFLASDPPTHPPPPRYSINQPLSKGLIPA